MACGVAISDVSLFTPRALAEVEARRTWRRVDYVGSSASGMFFKAPEFRRSQRTRFVEIKQSFRGALVTFSMRQDKSEIMAAQELADGSIFFSFGDRRTASYAEKEAAAFLTPHERFVISRIDLPKRLPSRFTKQLPYLSTFGIQRAHQNISARKCRNSNTSNQNGPCRYPSFSVKKSSVPSSIVCKLSDFPVSGSTFGRESVNEHYSPNRLPSKFVKKSPIHRQLLVHSVPNVSASLHCKHPEIATQENVVKAGNLSSRLPSRFIKQSPISSSPVAVFTGSPANKNKLDGPPVGLATARNKSLTSARSITDVTALEDVKFHQGSKKIDDSHPKRHSRAVLSGGKEDEKRVSRNIKPDLGLSEVGMVMDPLPYKFFPSTQRVNEDFSTVSDELTKSDAAPALSIFPLVERHQRAPRRPPSNFIRVSPIASAARRKKVRSNNSMLEHQGIHNLSQSVLKNPPSPTSEPKQSHGGFDDKASKGSSIKFLKNKKKSGTHENGKANCSEGNLTLQVTESGYSSISITKPSSSTQRYPDYSQYTVPQLKLLAKSRRLRGYSKLRKQDLLELLQSLDH